MSDLTVWILFAVYIIIGLFLAGLTSTISETLSTWCIVLWPLVIIGILFVVAIIIPIRLGEKLAELLGL